MWITLPYITLSSLLFFLSGVTHNSAFAPFAQWRHTLNVGPGATRHSTGASSSVTMLAASSRSGPTYLERMVERKKIEVDTLLRQHQDPQDPLVMRMTYMASESQYNVTRALKRDSFGADGQHTMSVLVDMKRRSPTVPTKRNMVEFSSAGKFAELLSLAGADALMINTDDLEYGGRAADLQEASRAVRAIASSSRPSPPIIHKDIIIHPVQV